MNPVVAVIAPGAMGAPVGKRLVEHGLKVLTSLDGRSAATVARANAAGLIPASDEEIARADIILSILPPGDALPLAQRFAPSLAASNMKPVYVDCNAVSPPTVERIANAIAPTGCPFVDAGIIGAPPRPDYGGPTFYASGREAQRFATLGQFGLVIRVLDGPLSAASALKMSYGGITKGITAVAAAMFIAAKRGGSADALFRELKESQPQLCWPGSAARSPSCIPRPIAGWPRWRKSRTSPAITRPRRICMPPLRGSTSIWRGTSGRSRRMLRRSRISWARAPSSRSRSSSGIDGA